MFCCRGDANVFQIEDTDLGELTAITIGHDSSGNSSSWHLSHVEVTPLPFNPNSTQNPGHTTNFSCSGATSNSCGSPKSAFSSPMRLSMGRASQQGSMGLLASGSVAQRASVLGSPVAAAAAAAGVNAKAGVTYLFPCDAWLDERLGDGKTERRLLAAR
jgi:hypothetical protein